MEPVFHVHNRYFDISIKTKDLKQLSDCLGGKGATTFSFVKPVLLVNTDSTEPLCWLQNKPKNRFHKATRQFTHWPIPFFSGIICTERKVEAWVPKTRCPQWCLQSKSQVFSKADVHLQQFLSHISARVAVLIADMTEQQASGSSSEAHFFLLCYK